jgi:hypothetical protein
VTAPVAQESLFAISDLMVQFLFRYGKTERARSIPQSQGASRAGAGSKSKTETTATPACEKNCQTRGPRSEPLKRNGHAGASASSSHEDRKDAVDQTRVPGDTACGAPNSPRNVRGGGQRVCNKSRLARDTPPRGAADRILQRRKPAPAMAWTGRSHQRNEPVTIRLKSIDSVTTTTGQRKAVSLPMRQS